MKHEPIHGESSARRGARCRVAGKSAALGLALAFAFPAGGSAEGTAPMPAPGADGEVARYCANIADHARERRYALIEARLERTRNEIEVRREALAERTAELAGWVERREAFVALADDTLVSIYGAMRADTAGEQLALLPPTVGAAVLVRLKPRQASAVLASMPKETAAELASVIAAANARTDPRDTSGGNGGADEPGAEGPGTGEPNMGDGA